MVAAFAALTATASFAADISTKAPPRAPDKATSFNWTGLYVGGSVGYGRATDVTTQRNTGVFAGLFPTDNQSVASGLLYGGQVGYRHQFNWLVVGVEGGVLGSRIRSNTSQTAAVAGLAATTSTNFSIGTIWEARGIIGVVPPMMPNMLVYFAGGYAGADVQFGQSSALTPAVLGVGSGNGGGWKDGWTLGGGVEVAFARNWTIGAEYQRIKLGDVNVAYRGSGPAPVAPTFSSTTRVEADVVLARLNYRF